MRIRKSFGTFSMYLDPFLPGISRRLLRYGKREEDFFSVLEREIEPGMTVLDLGANIGHNSMMMASAVGTAGRVYAIEPDPRNLRLLRANIALNQFDSIVSVHECAVSDRDGNAILHLGRLSNLNSLSRSHNTRPGKQIEIPLVCLDTFFADKPLPGLIKMDIEGHEVDVMRGFEQTVASSRFPLKLLMEVHPVAYGKSLDMRAVLDRYFSVGFHCKYLLSAGVPRPTAIAARGYEPVEVFALIGRHTRGLYRDVRADDALDFACRLHDGTKVARAVLIERPEPAPTPDTRSPSEPLAKEEHPVRE